jgi:leucyl aminopeptidase
MKITVKESALKSLNADVLVIPVFKDIQNKEPVFVEADQLLNRLISQTLSDNKSLADEGKFSLFYTNSRVKVKRILVMGFGETGKLDKEKLRLAGGKLACYCRSNALCNIAFLGFDYNLKNIPVDDASKAFVEGVLLGAYSYDELKSKKPGNNGSSDNNNSTSFNGNGDSNNNGLKKEIESLLIIPQVKSDISVIESIIRELSIICKNINLARDLVNRPSNIITPSTYERQIRSIFASSRVKVKVLEEAQLRKEKMNCIIGVGKGSIERPRMVLLSYTPPKYKKTVALVGKGVTFDSGGINLKPTPYLCGMKGDMAGSAAVVAAIKTASELKLPVKIFGVMPLVENMPSGNALKTGDVLVALNGKSIEVDNTDAEGRLILADALTYSLRFKPDYMVDIATLTGAALVALGSRCSAAMSNDDGLVKQLIDAGNETNDLLWQLPLIDEYNEDMKSDVADIKNVGAANGEAGTIIGGMFLKNFVGNTKWVHIDIGGTSMPTKPKSYLPKGATGVPVRLLVRWLSKL